MTEDIRVYTENKYKPKQVTVHWPECTYLKLGSYPQFQEKDWPSNLTYYVVACNQCKPDIITQEKQGL